jgi:hypothetical protein
MTEVFTKRFWEGVKKTFEEAREGPAPAESALEGSASSGPETLSPPSGSSATHSPLPDGQGSVGSAEPRSRSGCDSEGH